MCVFEFGDQISSAMSSILSEPQTMSLKFSGQSNTAWVRARLCKLQKGCTRLQGVNDKVYQLLAHGRWLSPVTPASSTIKTGRHDIAEILLKVVLDTKDHSIDLSLP
jgi:hypothetical protein